MRLFHGTSGERLKRILERGIEPRQDQPGNFTRSLDSCPDAVYLTDCYPFYFAVNAIDDADPKPWLAAVVEVDTTMLVPKLLNADEDVLEQVGRGQDGLPRHWSMARRTEHYRDLLKTNRYSWEESLRLMGTCSYLGTIPVEAITRVATVDVLANPYVAHIALRPVIALPNYQFCSKEYRSLTRWVFGDDDESDAPFTHDFGDGLVVQDFQWPPAPHRDGITVTDLRRGT